MAENLIFLIAHRIRVLQIESDPLCLIVCITDRRTRCCNRATTIFAARPPILPFEFNDEHRPKPTFANFCVGGYVSGRRFVFLIGRPAWTACTHFFFPKCLFRLLNDFAKFSRTPNARHYMDHIARRERKQQPDISHLNHSIQISQRKWRWSTRSNANHLNGRWSSADNRLCDVAYGVWPLIVVSKYNTYGWNRKWPQAVMRGCVRANILTFMHH